MFVFKLTNSVLASCLYSLIIPHGFSDRVVKKTFEFLGQYSKFHEVDLAIISQLQYKHEAYILLSRRATKGGTAEWHGHVASSSSSCPDARTLAPRRLLARRYTLIAP